MYHKRNSLQLNGTETLSLLSNGLGPRSRTQGDNDENALWKSVIRAIAISKQWWRGDSTMEIDVTNLKGVPELSQTFATWTVGTVREGAAGVLSGLDCCIMPIPLQWSLVVASGEVSAHRRLFWPSSSSSPSNDLLLHLEFIRRQIQSNPDYNSDYSMYDICLSFVFIRVSIDLVPSRA